MTDWNMEASKRSGTFIPAMAAFRSVKKKTTAGTPSSTAVTVSTSLVCREYFLQLRRLS